MSTNTPNRGLTHASVRPSEEATSTSTLPRRRQLFGLKSNPRGRRQRTADEQQIALSERGFIGEKKSRIASFGELTKPAAAAATGSCCSSAAASYLPRKWGVRAVSGHFRGVASVNMARMGVTVSKTTDGSGESCQELPRNCRNNVRRHAYLSSGVGRNYPSGKD